MEYRFEGQPGDPSLTGIAKDMLLAALHRLRRVSVGRIDPNEPLLTAMAQMVGTVALLEAHRYTTK